MAASKMADLDQDDVERKISDWVKDPHDTFFFRKATQTDNIPDHPSDAVAKNLLERYGNTLCLLDGTYKTTKYALPLYFLVVKTNVDYMPVAECVVEDEMSTSLQEALEQV